MTQNTPFIKKVVLYSWEKPTLFAKKVVLFLRTKYRGSSDSPQRLAIEGIAPAPITPEPDAAEQAAAALLESLACPGSKVQDSRFKKDTPAPPPSLTGDGQGSVAYYTALAARIREGREMEERACRRWLAYCEQQLQAHHQTPHAIDKGAETSTPDTPSDRTAAALAALANGLYERQDVVDRVGGELQKRWQRCLAEVTVREMKEHKLLAVN